MKDLLFRDEEPDALLGGDLQAIAAALGGEVDGAWVRAPSPGCAADDRSMIIRIDPARPGDFFVYDQEGSLGAALALVREKLNLIGPYLRTNSTGAAAARLWAECIPAQGTLVEVYLRARALVIPVPPVLRFHPALYHKSGGHWPAMVAKVTDVNGALVAVHRTWLARDGSGKAPVAPAKMSLGPLTGGAIRLAPATEQVCVGEGIETCMSVLQDCEVPAWSAISCGGMRSVVLPKGINDITLLIDGDDRGQSERAAMVAYQRWRAEGRKAYFLRAPQGYDFNDMISGKWKAADDEDDKVSK